jgi:hypothetical protein
MLDQECQCITTPKIKLMKGLNMLSGISALLASKFSYDKFVIVQFLDRNFYFKKRLQPQVQQFEIQQNRKVGSIVHCNRQHRYSPSVVSSPIAAIMGAQEGCRTAWFNTLVLDCDGVRAAYGIRSNAVIHYLLPTTCLYLRCW